MYNSIHLKKIGTTLTNEEIESSIEKLLSLSKDERPDSIWLDIAELIGVITDCAFLKKIISRLRSIGLLQTRIGRLEIDDYSEIEKAKILASYYSLRLGYDYYEAMNRSINMDIEPEYFEKGLPYDMPALDIDINDSVLTFNIFEMKKFIQRKVTITDVIYADSQDPTERERFLRQLIGDFKELKYNTGFVEYQEQIDRLTYALEEPPSRQTTIVRQAATKHDLIFANDGFLLFDYFMGNFMRPLRGWKAKVAHVYWLMARDEYVRVKPEQFKRWFEKQYPQYENVGKFRTLLELKGHVIREDEYKACVDWYKTTAR